jgi:PncC family amidohydrolase
MCQDKLKYIISIFKKKNYSISTIESCTGGRIAAAITSVPGASDIFPGGIVTYQTWVKEKFIGVKKDLLLKFDVVSKQVAEQMVLGGCQMFDTDFAIATTGYAGPTTCNPEIPVGTIWIGFGNKNVVLTKCLHLNGSRENNINETIDNAIDFIITNFNIIINKN